MTWRYEQATGKLTNPRGVVAATGYSGNGKGLNNPAMEDDRGVGPVPKGKWHINLNPLEHTSVGPLALEITPVGHTAHGRTLFRIHGDNKLGNRSASHGCIILQRPVRQAIIDWKDTSLEVV